MLSRVKTVKLIMNLPLKKKIRAPLSCLSKFRKMIQKMEVVEQETDMELMVPGTLKKSDLSEIRDSVRDLQFMYSKTAENL